MPRRRLRIRTKFLVWSFLGIVTGIVLSLGTNVLRRFLAAFVYNVIFVIVAHFSTENLRFYMLRCGRVIGAVGNELGSRSLGSGTETKNSLANGAEHTFIPRTSPPTCTLLSQ